jgi:hypothetical protein
MNLFEAIPLDQLDDAAKAGLHIRRQRRKHSGRIALMAAIGIRQMDAARRVP